MRINQANPIKSDVIRRAITQAKRHLSALIQAVLARHEVIVSRPGKAAVKLVPVTEQPPSRDPGGLKNLVMAKDFDATDDEIIASFLGSFA